MPAKLGRCPNCHRELQGYVSPGEGAKFFCATRGCRYYMTHVSPELMPRKLDAPFKIRTF